MTSKRKIIEIDESKCTGCGQCIPSCAEGALAIVDGKARLVKDIYCDGLGACLGECPEGALKIVDREAEAFDEKAAAQHIKNRPAGAQREPAPAREETLPCGCPSATAMSIKRCEGFSDEDLQVEGEIASELIHWPIKLKLLAPQAPFLKDADLLLLADCAGVAYPELHRRLLRGNAVATACPKFDFHDADIEKLAEIIKLAPLRSLTVVHMEVPCCRGLLAAAVKAKTLAGADIPLNLIVIARTGGVLTEERVS